MGEGRYDVWLVEKDTLSTVDITTLSAPGCNITFQAIDQNGHPVDDARIIVDGETYLFTGSSGKAYTEVECNKNHSHTVYAPEGYTCNSSTYCYPMLKGFAPTRDLTINLSFIDDRDVTDPSISIISPITNTHFDYTSPSIAVIGTSSDNVDVSKVEVKVGSGSWQRATLYGKQ